MSKGNIQPLRHYGVFVDGALVGRRAMRSSVEYKFAVVRKLAFQTNTAIGEPYFRYQVLTWTIERELAESHAAGRKDIMSGDLMVLPVVLTNKAGRALQVQP